MSSTAIRSAAVPATLHRAFYWPAYAVLLLASMAVFFERQIATGFTFVFGEPWDGGIQAVLLSHWLKTLQLLQHWNQVPYFEPYRDTLGYNDGGFITGLLTVPFRIAGLDIYRAPDCAVAIIKVAGFVFMVSLLDRLIARRSLASLFGACLFTVIIGPANQAGHTQLLTVALAPLQLLLLLNAVHRLRGDALPFLLWAAASCALMGAWLLTSYYMAWFFLLFAGALLVSQAVADFGSLRIAGRRLIADRAVRLVGLVVLFGVSITPFLLVYGPKLHETHGHHIAAALAYKLTLDDFINIGPGSVVWGWLYRLALSIHPTMGRGETNVGFTPDLLLLLVVFAVLVLVNRTLRLSPALKAIAGAGLIMMILPQSIAGMSPWWLVFKIVPGASGVRVVARAWLMVAFPVCILVTCVIHHLAQSKASAWLAWGLATLAVAGQINAQPPIFLNVPQQLALLDAVPSPPSTCRNFFVVSHSPEAEQSQNVVGLYKDNVVAMVIADRLDLPTIQGFSTFNPPDWNFSAFPNATYLARVKTYVAAHGLRGVCGYDLDAHAWSDAPFGERL